MQQSSENWREWPVKAKERYLAKLREIPDGGLATHTFTEESLLEYAEQCLAEIVATNPNPIVPLPSGNK
ncbi:MAG: hypothetical protein ACHQ9S_26585 [Candidatus Binatia bacterium]